jgi:hypothetical protein
MRLILQLLLCLLLFGCELPNEPNQSPTTPPKTNTRTENPDDPRNTPGPNSGGERRNEQPEQLSYQGKRLRLTQHAKCRMDCREIDAAEIQEIINKNQVNLKKTDPNGKPCPTVAYEGRSRDNQRIRVIVGNCADDPKVVTVIDLENDYKCTCN